MKSLIETVNKRGKYYKSLAEWERNGGNKALLENAPSIHKSGSVKGMRKLFWGYQCDVVRVGSYIYKV